MDDYEIIDEAELSRLSDEQRERYEAQSGDSPSAEDGGGRRKLDLNLVVTIPLLIVCIVSMAFSIRSYYYIKNLNSNPMYIRYGAAQADDGNIIIDVPEGAAETTAPSAGNGSVSIVTQANALPATVYSPSADRNTTASANAAASSASVSVYTTSSTATSEYSGIVNINTASLEMLKSLDGIGDVKAQAIIDYRNSHGGFTAIEEIMNVTGIGEKTFANIKNRITV